VNAHDEPIGTHCARCMRPAPDWLTTDRGEMSQLLDWEALGDDGLLILCPDCITPEEQQAMDADMMDWLGTELPEAD